MRAIVLHVHWRSTIRIVALEEHFVTPAISGAWQAQDPRHRDLAVELSTTDEKESLLLDLADRRIAQMDAAGVDVQVLSVTTPGVQTLEPDVAVPLARAANDAMAETIRARPGRFEGFATLPTTAPAAAADELARAVGELGLSGAMVFGRTGDKPLSDSAFRPVLEVAAQLRAPLYLHPQSPPSPVRAAYYDGFDHATNVLFATGGIGWHYETGIQALRLILSGVFDRLPDLQIILGHWGEVVMFYLDRIDMVSGPAALPRAVSEYFTSNVSVTPGGIFSQRYLQWALDVIGVDRILFATDYPFQLQSDHARRFLQDANITDLQREQIGFGNWDRLSARIRR